MRALRWALYVGAIALAGALSIRDARALDIAAGATFCAGERQTCGNANTDARFVRYGVGESWVLSNTPVDAGSALYCTTDAFGGVDPAYGVQKSCYLVSPAAPPPGPAASGATIALTAEQLAAITGGGTSWMSRSIDGSVMTPALAGEAFFWGMSTVISSYLVAWCAGQVLAMIGRR